METKKRARGFTADEQAKGRDIAINKRKATARERQAQVAIMLDAGKPKAEIARHFGVSWETVNRDSKAIATETPRGVVTGVIDSVLAITRQEVAGEMTTLEARAQIQRLIERAVDAEKENADALQVRESDGHDRDDVQ